MTKAYTDLLDQANSNPLRCIPIEIETDYWLCGPAQKIAEDLALLRAANEAFDVHDPMPPSALPDTNLDDTSPLSGGIPSDDALRAQEEPLSLGIDIDALSEGSKEEVMILTPNWSD